MKKYSKVRSYDIDQRIPEIYDSIETYTEDINLIRDLVNKINPFSILEPFCGNGRILIPLAQDGYTVTGIDKSSPMLKALQEKAEKLPASIRGNIIVINDDVLSVKWPHGFDVIVLGGNCLYELSTPEEQEKCISLAAEALKPGGYLYLDNDHMEGALDQSWCKPDIEYGCFPTGKCSDGAVITSRRKVIWYDSAQRLVQYNRVVEINTPEGDKINREWVEQKHPPSTTEMQEWLNNHGFKIEYLWGDRKKSPYTDTSPRAVFWVRLIEK